MDKTAKYQDILVKLLQEETQVQPQYGPVRVIPVCDANTKQYLMVAIGWEGKRHFSSIVFHARLAQGKIIIEDDNTEEGLAGELREAGVPDKDILFGWQLDREEAVELLAA